LFFDRFREALSRLPAGLIRPGPTASDGDVAAAEARLGKTLPPSFAAFLRSFDGVDLFHESIVIGGVGAAATRPLADMRDPQLPGALVFAEALGGDRFAFDGDGRVMRLRGAAPDQERWRSGGDFERWLDGIIAHQRVLYGPDGEFSPDAFEPDGAEVVPLIALRQTERALRACDDSAEWHHERGVALRRLGRLGDARAAFARAAALDPQNPWPRFDAGRAALELGPATAREARLAFSEAARLEVAESRALFWVWAARAALLGAEPEQVSACRAHAVAEDPAIGAALRRARDAAAADDDAEALAEAEALLAALEGPIPSARARLPVLSGGPPPDPAAGVRVPTKVAPPAPPQKKAPAPASTRRTPPPDPRRPRPAKRRPPGGPRPGSRR
jgi:hypothetical protein